MNSVTVRKPTRAEKKAATRRRLLDAAAQVFLEKGLRLATLDEIAERAGLTKGAVYSNFESKEELFLAVARDRAVPLPLPSGSPSGRGLAGSLRSLMVGASRGARRRSAEMTELATLQMDLALLALRDAGVRERLRKLGRGQHSATAAWLESHSDPTERVGVDTADLALIVEATVNGLLQQRLLDPAAVPDRVFDIAAHLLANGAAEARHGPTPP